MGEAIPFPQSQPRGYEWLEGEPAFDPERHLQLEEPAEVLMLADLGYRHLGLPPPPGLSSQLDLLAGSPDDADA